jgi:hypothetical protein
LRICSRHPSVMRVHAQGRALSPSSARFRMSRLADQIQQVLPAFSELETPPALIDGLPKFDSWSRKSGRSY